MRCSGATALQPGQQSKTLSQNDNNDKDVWLLEFEAETELNAKPNKRVNVGELARLPPTGNSLAAALSWKEGKQASSELTLTIHSQV